MPPGPQNVAMFPHHHQSLSFLYVIYLYISVEIGKKCLVSKFSYFSVFLASFRAAFALNIVASTVK